ncbi:MAG: pyridoxal-phosphate dependent enzyme [Acidobacteriota bacterium]
MHDEQATGQATAAQDPVLPPIPTRVDLDAAWATLEGVVHRTPVVTCSTLDRRAGASLFLKCEQFQRVGAFKFRGASFALARLDEAQRARGVVTHSSGNHGQALACAARSHGIDATIVVPEGAPEAKVAAIAGYGATVVRCAPTGAARVATAHEIVERTGAVQISSHDHFDVIAGQSTAARELLDEVPDLNAVVVPVGGGGLLSGTALCAHHLAPRVRVIGAEPAGANDAARSLAAGRLIPCDSPQTIADGLRTSLAPRTFAIARRHVERILTVDDDAIVRAMRLVWERAKLMIEPSSAVAVAALLEPGHGLDGCRVGIVLTGGNVDLDRLPW